MNGPVPRDDAGFTLIETLVALTVFVACFLLVQQAVSGAFGLLRIAESETAALAVAKHRLALASVNADAGGETGGTTPDGYAWRVEVVPYRGGSPAAEAAPTLAGIWISVRVDWRESALARPRSLTLRTLRLDSVEPAP